jgi:hypothetical protein
MGSWNNMWGGGKMMLVLIVLLILQLLNNLLDRNLLGHNVQTVLCQDNVAALNAKNVLDRGGVLTLVLHEVLGVILDTDAALLITAIGPVI